MDEAELKQAAVLLCEHFGVKKPGMASLIVGQAKEFARSRVESLETALAAMTAERDALKADVSMRSREVFRESQLRRKIEEMMKEHAEYLRENRLLDDQARAAVEGER